MRSFGAFLVAPFPAALLQAIVVAIWPREAERVFENPASMFVAICLYFYIFGLSIGLPAWLWLWLRRGRRAVSLRALSIIGLLIGLIPVGSALAVTAVQSELPAYVVAYNLALFGLGGAAAGALFWLIACRREVRTG